MELDYSIGKILQSLKDNGVDKDTLVFFTSDNGAATYAKTSGGSNGPFLCGKETTFEGGLREPTIAWWPGNIQPGKVSNQVGTLMDFYTTFIDLAGGTIPTDRIIDGIGLKGNLLNNIDIDRPVYYYRGNELMAIKLGYYKAHLWTWTNSIQEFNAGVNFCPGQEIDNVTTHDQMNHTSQPLLFHIGRDPGEKYVISPQSVEYKEVMPWIQLKVNDHKTNLVPGEPQLNMCDRFVMNWSPPGCEKFKCLKAPAPSPYMCSWTH